MSEVATARLADVLGALSSATDLAAGVPMDTALRTCIFAAALGAAYGLDESQRADVYYASLLRHMGCTSLSHEAAGIAGGDDLAFQRDNDGIDVRQMTPTRRALDGDVHRAVCDQAVSLAADLGMSNGVVRALSQMYERFDGAENLRLSGDAIDAVARVLHLAALAEVWHRRVGRERALEEVRLRRGSEFEPELCDRFSADAESFWPLLEGTSLWDAYLAAEPGERSLISEARLDAVSLAFGRFADLKSTSMLGHSPAVAALAVAAAKLEGLDPGVIRELGRAALLHDLGIVSVPNGILEKPAALTPNEQERMRLHAYYTNVVLSRVPALVTVARIASLHHERCDASGYFRGIAPAASERAARLLAATDYYQALTEARPYRAAISATDASHTLQQEALAGRLCRRAVDSVLSAAGQTSRISESPPARSFPAGLTAREAQVLAHIARGLTSKEVATALAISTRTVDHHLEHIYAKVGVSTRAAAALFAVRHELLNIGE
jgi:HD-GYP domain-containing protein (c-di-GMP phosphodiesterase class II)